LRGFCFRLLRMVRTGWLARLATRAVRGAPRNLPLGAWPMPAWPHCSCSLPTASRRVLARRDGGPYRRRRRRLGAMGCFVPSLVRASQGGTKKSPLMSPYFIGRRGRDRAGSVIGRLPKAAPVRNQSQSSSRRVNYCPWGHGFRQWLRLVRQVRDRRTEPTTHLYQTCCFA
jgi:hypothetical protein